MSNEDENENEKEKDVQIGPGYPFAQLMKAMHSTGATASKKVQQWQDVIRGMLDGALEIGSRMPTGKPAWVTLDVVTGGFATGGFAAGGPLLPHEFEKLATIGGTGRTIDSVARGALNAYYLSAPGNAELLQLLASREYRITVPEEGALMIAAWLDAHGEPERARELRETIMPFFHKLRFYPMPHKRAFRSGGGMDVYIRTVGQAVGKLRSRKPKDAVVQMNEALMVWTPLYDRAVALFLETVEGGMPTLERDDNGELRRQANGQPIATGGWPCQRYADDWRARANALLLDYQTATNKYSACKKHAAKAENFARLREYLQRCIADPKGLSGRDVGSIRKILASYVAAHGTPDSAQRIATRANQQHMASLPLHSMVSQVVANRLLNEPADEGLAQPENFTTPLTEAEASELGAEPGLRLPRAIVSHVLACMEAPLRVLTEKRIVPSSETLGISLPILTGRMRVKPVVDPQLAALIEQEYRAFRRRRSLLLLNLQSQVQFDELPWIAAVAPWTGSDAASREAARAALQEAAACALIAFPQTIIPNKLMKEFRGLASAAALNMPLVDELAADIFMGQFSANFLNAAKVAGELLRGSLYERYYGVNYSEVLAINDVKASKWGAATSERFAAICKERAEQARDGMRPKGFSVAANGMTIEQSQILTTQNLASLFSALDLREVLASDLPAMARNCFKWICRRLQQKFADWQIELQALKNCAYAWRQLIFFLSLLPPREVDSFISWANEHLAQQPSAFQTRFRPAFSGLERVVAGEAFSPNGTMPDGSTRFLGWSLGRHWLRAAATVEANAPAP